MTKCQTLCQSIINPRVVLAHIIFLNSALRDLEILRLRCHVSQPKSGHVCTILGCRLMNHSIQLPQFQGLTLGLFKTLGNLQKSQSEKKKKWKNNSHAFDNIKQSLDLG